ncbi:4-fold beta flower protein [Aliivibrio fischeri]|uniref:4-fold beta flower protein n=1 Tax=Aliivibrio fischeri TaxID=668 RepID=UPI00080DADCC|nr:hypothetical protein [Aliivibrio fischeri]OCH42338.1 hypothetical protein A6E02_14225 [Aliivibrio fischeri]
MTPIYRWNGQCFGFIKNDRLFSASSQYLGWVTEDGRVWRRNGAFLGEVENENYILRRTSMATPATLATPPRRANRADKASRVGQFDALDEFAST